MEMSMKSLSQDRGMNIRSLPSFQGPQGMGSTRQWVNWRLDR
jgi:hypothetical protein